MKNLNGLQGSSSKRQSGFTLIEIAIVLVIIGLLLGGVLQGQQLIENSRVKTAISEFNGISAAAFSYQDRYGRLPGDDGLLPALVARGGSWTVVTATGNLDGVLAIPLTNTFDGGGDATAFFQHLRAAGFLSGDPAATATAALPQNPFGGLVGLTNDATVHSGLGGTKICMSNVTGTAATALDNQLDDGSPNTGRFRANASTGNTAPSATAIAAYVEDGTFAVCYRLQ